MADRIKLYMDEHVPLAATRALRRRGIDVVRAQDVGLHPADDAVHLDYATRDGSVVVRRTQTFCGSMPPACITPGSPTPRNKRR